jgi:hypothetical protein
MTYLVGSAAVFASHQPRTGRKPEQIGYPINSHNRAAK